MLEIKLHFLYMKICILSVFPNVYNYLEMCEKDFAEVGNGMLLGSAKMKFSEYK